MLDGKTRDLMIQMVLTQIEPGLPCCSSLWPPAGGSTASLQSDLLQWFVPQRHVVAQLLGLCNEHSYLLQILTAASKKAFNYGTLKKNTVKSVASSCLVYRCQKNMKLSRISCFHMGQ